MDDQIRNVSLDKALQPDRNNPLMPWQFIPNTGLNVFKIIQSGVATIPAITATPGSQSVVVNHNLGYVPVVIAYLGIGSVSIPMPYYAVTFGGVNDGKVTSAYYTGIINSSSVTFYHAEGSLGNTTTAIPIKYFLLRDAAN